MLNLAVLVPREKLDELHQDVAGDGSEVDENLQFEVTGPWPPYNFVTLRIHLEKEETAGGSGAAVIILDDILLAPGRSLMWIFRSVHRAVQDEMDHEGSHIRARLSEMYQQLERGEITEEQFDQRKRPAARSAGPAEGGAGAGMSEAGAVATQEQRIAPPCWNCWTGCEQGRGHQR